MDVKWVDEENDATRELVATDRQGSVARLAVDGWSELDRVPIPADGFHPNTQRSTGAKARSILGPSVVTLVAGQDGSHTVAPDDGSTTVDAPACIEFDAAVRVEVAVPDDVVRVTPSADEGVRLSFPAADGPVSVGIGLRPRRQMDREVITTTPTAKGIADALSVAHRTIDADGPTRTWPSVRDPLPSIQADSGTSVPTPEAEAGSSVTLQTPADPEALLPLSSLAVYLGCSIDVRDGPIVIDAGDIKWTTPPPAGSDALGSTQPQRKYEEWVHEHFQRVFWLDCLAREAGEFADPHPQTGLLDQYGIDRNTVWAGDAATRLDAYNAVPDDEIQEQFPEWHLAVSVEPEWSRIAGLSQTLHRLPLVRVAKPEELNQSELIGRTMEAQTRGAATETQMVEPADEPPARHHCWVADGLPFAGWRLPRETQTSAPAPSAGEGLTLEIVVADPDMVAESRTVDDVFSGLDELELEVNVHHQASPRVLTSVLGGDADLVHLIGHCRDGRLQCWGGEVAPEEIVETDVSAVMLNACGTVDWGEHLVANGARSVVATADLVTEPSAAAVGQLWARLVARGWPVASALERIRDVRGCPEYVVIGDGATVVTQSDSRLPPSIQLRASDEKRAVVDRIENHPRLHGMQYTHQLTDDWYLAGEQRTQHVTADELDGLLDRLDSPVAINSELLWPDDREPIYEHL